MQSSVVTLTTDLIAGLLGALPAGSGSADLPMDQGLVETMGRQIRGLLGRAGAGTLEVARFDDETLVSAFFSVVRGQTQLPQGGTGALKNEAAALLRGVLTGERGAATGTREPDADDEAPATVEPSAGMSVLPSVLLQQLAASGTALVGEATGMARDLLSVPKTGDAARPGADATEADRAGRAETSALTGASALKSVALDPPTLFGATLASSERGAAVEGLRAFLSPTGEAAPASGSEAAPSLASRLLGSAQATADDLPTGDVSKAPAIELGASGLKSLTAADLARLFQPRAEAPVAEPARVAAVTQGELASLARPSGSQATPGDSVGLAGDRAADHWTRLQPIVKALMEQPSALPAAAASRVASADTIRSDAAGAETGALDEDRIRALGEQIRAVLTRAGAGSEVMAALDDRRLVSSLLSVAQGLSASGPTDSDLAPAQPAPLPGSAKALETQGGGQSASSIKRPIGIAGATLAEGAEPERIAKAAAWSASGSAVAAVGSAPEAMADQAVLAQRIAVSLLDASLDERALAAVDTLAGSADTAAEGPLGVGASRALATTDAATATKGAQVLDMSKLLQSGGESRLAEHVKWSVQAGLDSAEVKLHPPSLGALDVRISMEGDRASVHFVSAHPIVREVLEAALPRLRETLLDQGVVLGTVTVSDRAADDGRGQREPSAVVEWHQQGEGDAGEEADERGPQNTAMAALARRLDCFV